MSFTKKRWILLILVASTLLLGCRPAEETPAVGAPSGASPAPPTEPALDAPAAAPSHYRVLDEAPGARVVLASWNAGDRDAWHSHPTSMWYALTDSTLRVHQNEDTALPRRIEARASGVQQPIARHSVENTGTTEARLVMFEPTPAGTGGRGARAQAPSALLVANEFRLLEEHEGHRLIEVVLPVGKEVGLHSHPAALWFALTDADLRFDASGSARRHEALSEGEVVIRKAIDGHTVANTGPAEVRFLILETD